MDPARWETVKRLFHEALERQPAERESYLATAAGHDPTLVEEVRALLSADGHTDPFSVLTRTGGRRPLPARTRLGPYEIVSLMGAGGMGEVYKARDTRLDRTVAIKVLPPEIAGDPDMRKRFEREARTISRLSHPYICALHDVGEHEGRSFLVMEYLEGESLAERLRSGPLAVEDALHHAKEIAEALEEAHQHGIVHRDLKPANIMLTKKGAKLLDFGIAKVRPPVISEEAATATASALTAEGLIVGTPQYMAPEQLEGRAVDARTDIFAFGLVLYEMVSGRRAFDAPSRAALIAAILERDPPPLSQVEPQSPPWLEALVERCLAKRPAKRWQSCAELLAELDRRRGGGAMPTTPGGRKRSPLVSIAGAGLAVLVAGVAALLIARSGVRLSRSPEAAPVSFQNAMSTRLTDQPGPELFPSLSPDGKTLVYAARAKDNWDIFLQRVGGKNPINLTADSPVDDNHPAFSPDGEQVAFQSDRNGGGIYLMGATGESVRRLTDFGYHPAWSPDGKEIVFASAWIARPEVRMSSNSKLWVVTVATGDRRPLDIKAGGDAVEPQWSPNGHRIAYWGSAGGRRDVWTVAAGGGEAIAVTDDGAIDWSPVWSADGGHLFFSSDRGGSMNLWRVPIDERSGRTLGPAEAITTPSPDSAQISFSRDGRRLAYVQRVATRNVQKVRFDDTVQKAIGEPEWVTQGSKLAVMPEASPQGGLLAFFTLAPSQEDIFVVAPDGSGLRQLTDDAYRDLTPRWSPDGKQLAFMSNRSGRFEIWTINPDGGGLRQVTFTSGVAGALSPVWSPDGTRLAYTIQNDMTYVIDPRKPWAEQSPQALPRPGRDEWFRGWTWSPDGRSLAGFITPRSGLSSGIAIYSFGSKRYNRLTDFGLYPVWLKDGRGIVFCFKEKLYVVDVASKKPREIMYAALSARTGEMLGAASVSPDERTLYFAQGTIEADVWMLTAQ